MSSRQYQQYSQIFAAPYIVAALILPRSAIYRTPGEFIAGHDITLSNWSQIPSRRLQQHLQMFAASSIIPPVNSSLIHDH